MQSAEIILFVSEELFYGLTAICKKTSVTAVRTCPEKYMVILRMNHNTSIWHKTDSHLTSRFLSPLKIMYTDFLKRFFDS